MIKFLGLSNAKLPLPPQPAVDMANVAATLFKGVYDQSWQRKNHIDAILAAEDLDDDEKRPAIQVIQW